MKITKSQLKQIIQEELEEAMLTLEMSDTDFGYGEEESIAFKSCPTGKWVKSKINPDTGQIVSGYCDI